MWVYCKLGPNKTPCIKQFSLEYITNVVLSFRELTSEQLDLVILGQLSALLEAETTGEKKNDDILFQSKNDLSASILFHPWYISEKFQKLENSFSNKRSSAKNAWQQGYGFKERNTVWCCWARKTFYRELWCCERIVLKLTASIIILLYYFAVTGC